MFLSMLVAGCGDSKSDSGSEASAAGATTSSTGGGNVQAASAEVAKLTEQPTAIPVTTPLPKKPAPGKTFVVFKCENPQCKEFADSAMKAAAAAGWKGVAVPFNDVDPSTLAPAMERAIRMRPAAVFLTGMPYELWKSYLPQLKKIGAIMVPGWVGPLAPNPVIPTNIAGPAMDQHTAHSISNWIAADSGGKGKAMIMTVDAYPAVVGWAKDIQEDIKKVCPGCNADQLHVSGQQATSGASPKMIVSYLRTHPDTKYVVTYNGAFVPGLNQAVKTAGLKDIKIVNLYPMPQDIADVKSGSGGAMFAINAEYAGFLAVDAALRHAQGAPALPADQTVLPLHLAVKDSATQADANYKGPADYQDQFLKLWKVK
jgi:ribose transport system substrate-binding protein